MNYKEADITALVNKYPDLYSKHADNIGFGVGWLPLIETLSSLLQEELSSLPPEVKPSIYVVQVKQKFGGLRFYMNESTPLMEGAISMAESLSFQICESCSGPAEPVDINGWVTTMCTKCQLA